MDEYNRNFVPNIDNSTIQLKNSLLKYQLSVYYRKINLDKFNFNHHNKTYTSMTRIMVGLSDLIKIHDTIKNIVLVLNKNNYELYMISNESYVKLLKDKGMTVLKYAIPSNKQSINKKRKIYIDNSNNNSSNDFKRFKPNHKFTSLIMEEKKGLKNKRSEPKINPDSIDNKLIEKFRNLSENDKNSLLSFLNKGPNLNNEKNNEHNNINYVIDKVGNTDSSKNITKIEKEIIVCEPSIGEITFNKDNTIENDESEKIITTRKKRNIKKITRYEHEYF